MCLGFELLYEMSQLSVPNNKRFSFNVSKFYRNNSRQPSFEVLSEQFTTTEFRSLIGTIHDNEFRSLIGTIHDNQVHNTLRTLFSQVASQRCFWNITENALSVLLMLFYYI